MTSGGRHEGGDEQDQHDSSSGGSRRDPWRETIPALPIRVSSTGSWKHRPKAMMNFIVSARYSLIVPRNWMSISLSAPRPRPARGVLGEIGGAELLEGQEEVEGDRQHDVEGEGAADEEQRRRRDQERQERVLFLR